MTALVTGASGGIGEELAIKNYRRSLELNPQNKDATEKLKKLEGKQ